MKKVYIIRKYIVANSASQAIRKEKHHKVDDCWMEENKSRNYLDSLTKEPNKKRTGF